MASKLKHNVENLPKILFCFVFSSGTTKRLNLNWELVCDCLALKRSSAFHEGKVMELHVTTSVKSKRDNDRSSCSFFYPRY